MVNSSNNPVPGSRTWYLPFGGYRPGSAPTQTITDRDFTGQLENMELGLLYYQARFYVPGLGRFASADSIVPNPADPQSYNRYAYVENRPLNFIDADGHMPTPVDDGGGGLSSTLPAPLYEGPTAIDAHLAEMSIARMSSQAIARSIIRGVPNDLLDDVIPDGNYSLQGPLVKQTGSYTNANNTEPPETSDQAIFNRPTTFRQSTLKNAKAEAPTNTSGELICPTCRSIMPDAVTVVSPSGYVRIRRGLDLDHYPQTWAQKIPGLRNTPGITRLDVLNAYNEGVRAQCFICNQGHLWEGIPGE